MLYAQDSPKRPAARILIVCLPDLDRAIRRLLGSACPADWERDERVRLHVLKPGVSRGKTALANFIDSAAPPSSFAQVWVQSQIELHPRLTSAAGTTALRPPIRRFASPIVLKKELPQVIATMDLGWQTQIADELTSGWVHGATPLSRNRVDLWLDQFGRLGDNNRWIGEGLLRVLDFWLPERQRRSLGLTADILQRYDRVCVNRHRTGKSGDFLSTILQKHIQTLVPRYPATIDLRELCDNPSAHPDCKRVLFVEDGLFTATETNNYLSGLLDLPLPPHRNEWGTPALKDPAPLRSLEITMCFPVATTFGMKRLQAFLNANELTNINVMPAADGIFNNLTQQGTLALTENRFFLPDHHLCPAQPDLHLRTPAFENISVWKSEEKALRAKTFCYDVGLQLFRHYLEWRGLAGKWEESRILHCGLGMYGLGMAVAFGHSVPKASLPLFWMDGDVTIGGNSLKWQPLFPDAKA